MKRKRRKLAAIICALTLALSSAVPVSACTPPLKSPSVEIPDINFEPDDALKEAISNAAKNWILKCILGTPTVEYSFYCDIIVDLLFNVLNSNSSHFLTGSVNLFFVPYWLKVNIALNDFFTYSVNHCFNHRFHSV